MQKLHSKYYNLISEELSTSKITILDELLELEAQLSITSFGSLGGKKRKETTTLEQRRSWGKLGGRPRKIIGNNDIINI